MISAETLSLLAGAVLSLLFSYVPGLSAWYERLGDGQDRGTRKRLVMLGLPVLVSLAVFGLSCAGWRQLRALYEHWRASYIVVDGTGVGPGCARSWRSIWGTR